MLQTMTKPYLLSEVFLPRRSLINAATNWQPEQFEGYALKESATIFAMLVDVHDLTGPARAAAIRNNCRAVMATLEVWATPSLTMTEYRNARFAAPGEVLDALR